MFLRLWPNAQDDKKDLRLDLVGSATHLIRNRQEDFQHRDDDPHEYLFLWDMTIIILILNIDCRAHLNLISINVTDQSLVRQLLTFQCGKDKGNDFDQEWWYVGQKL